MRQIVKESGRDPHVVCPEYARREENGEVVRKSNRHNLSAERYAHALLRDGIKKGWL